MSLHHFQHPFYKNSENHDDQQVYLLLESLPTAEKL